MSGAVADKSGETLMPMTRDQSRYRLRSACNHLVLALESLNTVSKNHDLTPEMAAADVVSPQIDKARLILETFLIDGTLPEPECEEG